MLSRFGLACIAAIAGSLMPGWSSGQEQGAETRYLEIVQRAADTLLENSLDTHGEQQSGMILSVLDRNSGKPLRKLPKAPKGIRYGDRTGPGGSNANLQQDLYRVLYHLSRITGDEKYSEASDRAIADFLRITQHPETGMLAWGEHLYWNCFEDRLGDLDPNQTHEQKRPFATIERAMELDQERVVKYARGLWEYGITDHETGNFTRHGKWHRKSTGKDMDFEKEASYYIDIWGRAYEVTGDPVFVQATRVLTQRFLGRMNERNLLDFDSSGRDVSKNKAVPLWQVSMALEQDKARHRLPAEIHDLLDESIRRHDDGFLALEHAPADPERGFLFYAYTDSGKPHPDESKRTDGHTHDWELGYGAQSTAMVANVCYTRQQQLGDSPKGDAYRKLIIDAAELYKTARPTDEQDIWAGEYGMAIFTELAAYRLTGDKSYLQAAKEIADLAIEVLWDGGKAALPSASSKTDYYDVTSYPDTTILALLALHEALNGLDPQVPISDLVR